jgi:hypothetical protein
MNHKADPTNELRDAYLKTLRNCFDLFSLHTLLSCCCCGRTAVLPSAKTALHPSWQLHHKPESGLPDGVDSWGIRVSIASPPQDLCVAPSLVVNDTVIMATDICTINNGNLSTLPQCISRRGGVFDPNDTTSDFVLTSLSDLAPDAEYFSFDPNFAEAANTTIQFPSDISLSYPIALAFSSQNSSISQFGLANDSVFLHEVVNAGLGPAAFGLLVGS